MVDQITADKGWSLEYTTSLTYRQFECLYERYWDRRSWEIEVAIKTNPFYSETKESGLIDATTSEGLEQVSSQLGIKVKQRVAKTPSPAQEPV